MEAFGKFFGTTEPSPNTGSVASLGSKYVQPLDSGMWKYIQDNNKTGPILSTFVNPKTKKVEVAYMLYADNSKELEPDVKIGDANKFGIVPAEQGNPALKAPRAPPAAAGGGGSVATTNPTMTGGRRRKSHRKSHKKSHRKQRKSQRK